MHTIILHSVLPEPGADGAVQRHYTAFLDMLRYQLTSRAEFQRLQATDPTTLTDLERAARRIFWNKGK